MIEGLHEIDLMWRLGWTLLHSVWQILLIGLFTALALQMTSRRSPSVRYLIGCTGLAALNVPLIATFLMIDSRESLTDSTAIPVTHTHQIFDDSTSTELSSLVVTSANSQLQYSDILEMNAGNPVAEPVASADDSVVATIAPWVPWFSLVWCAGVFLLATWNTGGWWVIRKLRRQGTFPVDELIAARVQALSKQLGVTQVFSVMISTLAEVPMVIGWFRPMILLPAGMIAGLPPNQLDAILAHELGHIRRHDYLVNLFQIVTESLLFFHPVVWLISKQIRIEREFCCDDFAVASCDDPSTIVQALAALESQRVAPSYAMSMTGRGTGISLLRARRLVGVTEGVPSRSILGTWGTLILIAGICFSESSSLLSSASELEVSANEELQSSDNSEPEKKPTSIEGIDVAKFQMDILYQGASDKPFHNYTFSSTPVKRKSTPTWQVQENDPEKMANAVAVYQWLHDTQFLHHATAGDINELPPADQRYIIRVKSGDSTYFEDLGWDIGTLLRLDSLADVLEAAESTSPTIDQQPETLLDPLLSRLSGLRRQWQAGNMVNDVRSQITSSRQSYAVGEQVPVALTLKNIGDGARKIGTIFSSAGKVEHPIMQTEFKVFNSFGRRVPFLAGTAQFLQHKITLESGDSVTYEFDLTNAHHLLKPDRYTVVHNSWGQLNSKSFDFVVASSGEQAPFNLVGKLLPITKRNWGIVVNPNYYGSVQPGANFEEVKGRTFQFRHYPPQGNIDDIGIAWFWLTDKKAIPKSEILDEKWPPKSQYVGKLGQWHFYTSVDERALKEWPKIVEDVRASLDELSLSETNDDSTSTELKVPVAIESTPVQDGVYALGGAYQQTLLELKEGRFRYWFWGDVELKPARKYPLVGDYSTVGQVVTLKHNLVPTFHSQWVFQKLDGEVTLWSQGAIDSYQADRTLETYGILKPTPLSAEEAWQTRGISTSIHVPQQATAGETPRVSVDVYNQGNQTFDLGLRQQLHELEVDGVWYRWSSKIRSLSIKFPPGASHLNIPFILDSKTWQTMSPGSNESLPLNPSPGVHTIRVGLLMGSPENSQDQPIRVVSNPISITIEETQEEDPETDPDRVSRIYSVDLKGENLTLLADENAIKSHSFLGSASWSPDGNAILFDTTKDFRFANTRLVKKIVKGPDAGNINDLGFGLGGVFSPDRTQIACYMHAKNPDGLKNGIYLMNSDGSDRKRVSWGSLPRWSPDGKSILAVSSFNAPRKYILHDIESGKTNQILKNQTGLGVPCWSPDGTQFAATVLDGEDRVLCTFTPEVEPDSRIELWRGPWHEGYEETIPSWSPDGKSIVFTVNGSTGTKILLIEPQPNTSTTELILAPFATSIRDCVWSPDGKRISFAAMGKSIRDLATSISE